jgi:hypothetical protein
MTFLQYSTNHGEGIDPEDYFSNQSIFETGIGRIPVLPDFVQDDKGETRTRKLEWVVYSTFPNS